MVLLVYVHERIERDPPRQLPIGRLVQDDRGVLYNSYASLRSGIVYYNVVIPIFDTEKMCIKISLGEGTDFLSAENRGEDGGSLDFTRCHILRSRAPRQYLPAERRNEPKTLEEVGISVIS